jgi:predicted RNA binding protein YcfA (HicA-like mRNA interferase family)
MKSISGKNFIKVLQKHGWNIITIKGSHHILMKEGCKERLSIPVHSNRDLKPGLLKFFMKTAGLTEKDL